MASVHRRLASRADDLFCALVVPAAIYFWSPPAAASACLLAVVTLLVCSSNYNCVSPVNITGSAVGVLAVAWLFSLDVGQLPRLALLAAVQLLVAGALLGRGGASVSGGEALLAGQAAALLCAASADELPALLLFGPPLYVAERAAIVHLLQTAFCYLLVFLGVVTYVPSARTAAWLHVLLALLAAAILVTTSTIINTNCLLWMFQFVTRNEQRVWLLTWWASLLGGALLFAAVLGAACRGNRAAGSQSVTRKLFHLLSCGVFVPGLLHDPVLLLAASAGLTFVFVVAEVARVCDLKPWSGILQTWFQPFLDSKDTGTLILSNIYLLVACSGPLWYQAGSVTGGRHLDPCLLAGVITVGVGDTVAAVVGSRLGRLRWPRSLKTMEGSLASAAAQLLFCYLLDRSGQLAIAPEAWRPLYVAVGATTLAEAFTGQADNLVLPPLFVAAFSAAAARAW